MSQAKVDPESRPDHAKIKAAKILHRHEGRENAISGKKLAEQVGVSHSTIRDWIPDITQQFRLPIANCQDGYYVVQDVEEFRRLMAQYEGQIQSSRERMQRLSMAFYGQRGVFGKW